MLNSFRNKYTTLKTPSQLLFKKELSSHIVTLGQMSNGDIFSKKHFDESYFEVVEACSSFKRDPMRYIRSLSPSFRKVLSFLFRFRKAAWMCLKHETIAQEIGCSIKTVQRATNVFVADGLLCKYQQHSYAPNTYILNPLMVRGPLSFTVWLNELPEQFQDDFISHDILPGNRLQKSLYKSNVRLNINTLKEVSLFKIVGGNVQSLVGERGVRSAGHSHNNRKWAPQFNKSVRKNNQNRKRGSTRLAHPVQSGLNLDELELSDLRSGIVSSMKLNNREKLKLFAFADSCLSFALQGFQGVGRYYQKREAAHFFNLCVEWCHERGMKPDWERYFRLCELYGVETRMEKKEALTHKKQPTRRTLETFTPPRKHTVRFLLVEIQKYKKLIQQWEGRSHPLGNTHLNLAKKSIERLKFEIAERLNAGEELEGESCAT